VVPLLGAVPVREYTPRRVRRVITALGFETVQAYRVHEPTTDLGLLAMAVFSPESNYSTPQITLSKRS
jgi:hypothetical protein